MKIRNLALVLGAAFTVAAGGFAATACSSNNPAVTGGGYDSGTVRDSSTGNDSGNTGNDSGMMGSDAGDGGNSCGSTPSLKPGDGGSIYCPFAADAGQYVTCSSSGFCHLDCPTATTYCCIGGGTSPNYYTSACQTIGQACDNPPEDAGHGGRPVQCEEAADCQGGDAGAMICCGTGGLPAQDPTCGYYKESPGFKATTCTTGTTCPSGQFQICSTDAECGSGKTCTPFKALGVQLGFCM